MSRVLVVISLIGMAGCAVEFTPPTHQNRPRYEVTYRATFNEVWDKLIEYSSQTFYGLDTINRDSGLITLSFSVENVGMVADCGMVTEGGLTMPALDYLAMDTPGIVDLLEFSGRINILVQDVSPDLTAVRVTARYVIQYDVPRAGIHAVWSFSSGGRDTETAFGQNVTCQPTYVVETSILHDLGLPVDY
jgi:hypothetical protein